MKLHISNGNKKLGAIPNISLPPITTCNPKAPCFKKCYAMKSYKAYPSCKNAWDENLDLWKKDPITFTNELREYLKTANPWGFRWFVGGDIPDKDFFSTICETAEDFPNTQFLMFTKQYTIVNSIVRMVIKEGKGKYSKTAEEVIPKNLHIIFSGWGSDWKVNNPYNFPTSQVILKSEEPRPEWKVCGGNCTDCKCRGVGCWELKYGETIAFYEH